MARILLGLVLGVFVSGFWQLALAETTDQVVQPVSSVQKTAFDYESYYAPDKDDAASQQTAAAGDGSKGNGGNGSTCCCGSSCCDKGCGDHCFFGDCCDLGDAWSLWDEVHPCESWFNVGGWFSLGYYNHGNGLFNNNNPGKFQLNQGWVYFDKEADAEPCCWDWGYRFDIMYGTDGVHTQAFGNNPGNWDYLNGYDHGVYSWALPQAYVDLAYGDLSVRVGHFFTIIGYEVVPDPDNFFYSHALTMYNSEPFTHTGALATYQLSEDVTLYGGWTLGWDTGFDQVNRGSNFLGGFSTNLADDLTFTYALTAGNLGARHLANSPLPGLPGGDGYSHSLVFDWTINDRWEYVLQSDCLRDSSFGEDNIGVNQYLFYTLDDCWKLGARVEWWKADSNTDFRYSSWEGDSRLPLYPNGTDWYGSKSYYEATFGVNYKPNANFVVRPEYRQGWAPFGGYSNSIFAIDVIALW